MSERASLSPTVTKERIQFSISHLNSLL